MNLQTAPAFDSTAPSSSPTSSSDAVAGADATVRLACVRPMSPSSSSLLSPFSNHQFSQADSASFATNLHNFHFESETMVNLTLRTSRFVSVCTLAIAVLGTFLGVSSIKITLKDDVIDNVDDVVSKYNAIQGPIMFAMSKMSEYYLEVLVIPVFITYLNNTPFFPGDNPKREEYQSKKLALFWAMQLVLITLNIGWASLYIGQAVSHVKHGFAVEDLAIPKVDQSYLPNNLLRNSILGKSLPFKILTPEICNVTYDEFEKLSGTSVSYGFQRSEWNAFVELQQRPATLFLPPNNTKFTTQGTRLPVKYGDLLQNPQPFEDQMQANHLSLLTQYELFLQGKTLLEQSLSEMNMTQRYDCAEVNPKSAQKTCFGVKSSLHLLANYTNPSTHSLKNLMDAIATGLELSEVMPSAAKQDMQVTFQTTQLTSQILLESMALQVPITDGKFSFNGTFPIDVPCGTNRCIADVKSIFRKEVSLLPYQKNCKTDNMTYEEVHGQFVPSGCEAQQDAVFVYGLGSYVDGQFSEGRTLLNPKHILTLSFAKLSWKTDNIQDMFGVYGNHSALALAFRRNSTSQMDYVIASREAIPTVHEMSDLLMPYRLLTLSPAVMYEEGFDFFTYDRVRPLPLTNPPCEAAIESYVKHIESNFFYLEDPLEVSYMASLYYLFQHGAVFTGGTGNTTRIKHGQETKQGSFGSLAINNFGLTWTQIEFSVPASSAITTFVACGGMVLLMLFVVFLPTSRVKLNPNTTAAADYVDILTDDSYPHQVHEKQLVTSTGEQLDMEEFVVESIVLHAKADENKRIYL